ncbi:helix-turn-helix domain-containing protein [Candidatus Margulisiibacteriota bacterium]
MTLIASQGCQPEGTLKEKLQFLEKQIIRLAIKEHQGNQSQAAKKLGIGASTLSEKLKTLGI